MKKFSCCRTSIYSVLFYFTVWAGTYKRQVKKRVRAFGNFSNSLRCETKNPSHIKAMLRRSSLGVRRFGLAVDCDPLPPLPCPKQNPEEHTQNHTYTYPHSHSRTCLHSHWHTRTDTCSHLLVTGTYTHSCNHSHTYSHTCSQVHTRTLTYKAI